VKKQTIVSLAATATLALTAALPAAAFEAGDWVLKSGITSVDPKQSNGDLAVGRIEVAEDSSLSLTGQYFFTPNVSVELLASLPFEHDYAVWDNTGAVTGQAGSAVVGGSTKHLPPTLGIQYHFNTNGVVIPYVGLGVNYTDFFSTKANFGALAGADISIDSSFGVAAQIGADYIINDQLFLNVDVRYINIESDVKANGADIGEVEINPTLVGINVGYKF